MNWSTVLFRAYSTTTGRNCNFFVVQGHREVLLGTPDTGILNMLTINDNEIGTKETDRDANCNKKPASPRMQEKSSATQI